jgi:type II secretory pathway component PulM
MTRLRILLDELAHDWRQWSPKERALVGAVILSVFVVVYLFVL